ncbi:hypothetical protein, variant 1 [Aphanomyces astaci]|uniref:Uncharacterized protein n=1 Tax=Aphanomyces astaci TaxID=112090 RepID=W4GLN0_APHAT|nr:hypothetical protein, variant 1 [Aphanomyces astaci]ETV80271.1 hypothetical protein, variant 1 [Aphanomyces astaci]|eukprot:XP_009830195.1 hypothetical protein, variant 1 [Aphanomyces astaci]
MHNHDLMICMLQRNVQCELEGLRKMLHIQEQAAASMSNPAPTPPLLPTGQYAKALDKQEWDSTPHACPRPFRSRMLFQEHESVDPAAARCEAMLQQAERSADVLHESLESEAKELVHVREAMEVKWRGIAHQQADEIRDLKKAVAEKDKAIELLRNGLRQALQLALVHEEDLVTRSNATLRRNEELQKLATAAHETNQLLMTQVHILRRALEDQRATALDQREKEEQWRGMVEAQNRQLHDRLTQESQAKADMQATLVSVLQHNAPPMPPAHENVDAVRATPIFAPKLQLNKQPPSSIPSHPALHPQASAHGGTSIKNQFTTATVPSWK